MNKATRGNTDIFVVESKSSGDNFFFFLLLFFFAYFNISRTGRNLNVFEIE